MVFFDLAVDPFLETGVAEVGEVVQVAGGIGTGCGI